MVSVPLTKTECFFKDLEDTEGLYLECAQEMPWRQAVFRKRNYQTGEVTAPRLQKEGFFVGRSKAKMVHWVVENRIFLVVYGAFEGLWFFPSPFSSIFPGDVCETRCFRSFPLPGQKNPQL